MLLHADEEMQSDVASEQIFDVAPRLHADLFKRLAALADDDRLLRLALDVDHAMDFCRPPRLLPHLGPDGGGEGKLLRREFQNLFADEFSRDIAFDLVGEDFGVVMSLAFGQALEQFFDQRLVVVAFDCGNRNDLGEVILLTVLFDHRQQAGFVLKQVDLVQEEEGRFRGLFNQVERVAVAGAEGGRGVTHQQDYVDLLKRVVCTVHECCQGPGLETSSKPKSRNRTASVKISSVSDLFLPLDAKVGCTWSQKQHGRCRRVLSEKGGG